MTDDFVSPVNPLLHRLHHGQHIQENRRIHQSPSRNPQATDSLVRQLPRPRRIPQNRSKVTSSSFPPSALSPISPTTSNCLDNHIHHCSPSNFQWWSYIGEMD